LRIGLMSDSHDNLPYIDKALRAFMKRDVEFLLHLGDVVSPIAFMRVVQVPVRVYLITGNNDGDVAQLKSIGMKAGATIREKFAVINIEGRRIAAFHGFGDAVETLELAKALALSKQFYAVFYGHTHELKVESIDGVLVVNPGEVCGYLTGKHTVAIVDLDAKSVEVVDLDKEP